MNEFNELYKEADQLQQEIEDLKSRYQETMKQKFNEITKSFFEECPEVKALVWSQYTPYFNDGDVCVFGINDIYPVVGNFDPNELLDPYEYEYGEDEEGGRVTLMHGPDLEKQRAWYAGNAAKYDWGVELGEALEEQEAKYPGYFEKIGRMVALINSNEELMETMFGDHAAVYLMKDRVIVEEYSHD